MTSKTEKEPTRTPDVAWDHIVRFVRQLSHDLRNNLNAVELQAALLYELSETDDLKGEVNRLRDMMATMNTTLQKLTSALGPALPHPMPYGVEDFLQDLRKATAKAFPEQKSLIDWKLEGGPDVLEIDPQLLLEAAMEIFANAFQHQRGTENLLCAGQVADGRFILRWLEPKQDFARATEKWGSEPLQSTARGHYGLGLHRVRAIVESQGGSIEAHYDSGESMLVTTISLPLGSESA